MSPELLSPELSPELLSPELSPELPVSPELPELPELLEGVDPICASEAFHDLPTSSGFGIALA